MRERDRGAAEGSRVTFVIGPRSDEGMVPFGSLSRTLVGHNLWVLPEQAVIDVEPGVAPLLIIGLALCTETASVGVVGAVARSVAEHGARRA